MAGRRGLHRPVRASLSLAGRAALPTPFEPEVERLLETSWAARARRLDRRELRFEGLASLAFLLVAGALVAVAGAPGGLELEALAVLVGYALASRTDFPLGVGSAVPTQLFLVPLFALAAPTLVPLLVFAALVLGTVGAAALGRTRPDRVVFAGGDAAHALGPALVLAAAGQPDLREAGWLLLGGAFAAQLAIDLAATTAREWPISGVGPRLQLRVLAQVWAMDVALAPLALLVVHAEPALPWAPLAVLPLFALLASAARERSSRIARAHERMEALRNERMRLRLAARRVGDAFASNLDLDALLAIVARTGLESLGADLSRASVRGEGGLRRVSADEEGGATALLDRAEGRALRADGPVELSEGAHAALACAVRVDGEPVGVVAVLRAGGFEVQDAALLGYLCDQAAVSAANVEHHETLQRQALTDELTGLANQRRLQEQLEAAVERHARKGEPVALILFDLDDFKRVNDRHGHPTGDAVLREVGRVLRQECRLTDEPARYGGEELAVLARDADLDQAHALALRIRQALAGLRVTAPDDRPVRITASFGVAALGGPIATAADLLSAADSALYEAKRAGKNRVRALSPVAGTLTR